MRFILPLLVLLGSCNYGLEKPEVPDDLIEKDKMIILIKEMVKLESHVQQKYSRVDRYYKTMDRSGKELLKANGVKEDQFKRSMEYYSMDQTELNAMYDEALNLLNEELGNLQSN